LTEENLVKLIQLCIHLFGYFVIYEKSSADIRDEPAVEKSSVSKNVEVNHLGQYNRIKTNASLGGSLKQKSLSLLAQI